MTHSLCVIEFSWRIKNLNFYFRLNAVIQKQVPSRVPKHSSQSLKPSKTAKFSKQFRSLGCYQLLPMWFTEKCCGGGVVVGPTSGLTGHLYLFISIYLICLIHKFIYLVLILNGNSAWFINNSSLIFFSRSVWYLHRAQHEILVTFVDEIGRITQRRSRIKIDQIEMPRT